MPNTFSLTVSTSKSSQKVLKDHSMEVFKMLASYDDSTHDKILKIPAISSRWFGFEGCCCLLSDIM